MEGKEFNVTVALDQRLGQDGKSAYELWKEQGNEGSVADFLAKLKGEPGKAGKSAYELWVEQGNTGSVADYLAKQKGEKGDAAKVTTRTLTLEAAAWNTDSKQLTVAVERVTAENTLIISPAPDSIVAYGRCGVYAAAQDEGRLTFACVKQPEESLTVNVVIL